MQHHKSKKEKRRLMESLFVNNADDYYCG